MESLPEKLSRPGVPALDTILGRAFPALDDGFVRLVDYMGDDAAIVQAILSVARHLRLRVVAEGVETRQQADFLIAHHCHGLQGYLFGLPQPLRDWLAGLKG